MTNLSTLIRHLNHLEEFCPEAAVASVSRDLDPLIYVITNHAVQVPTMSEKLLAQRSLIDSSISTLLEIVSEIKHQLKSQVEKLEPRYLATSYQMYAEYLSRDRDRQLIDRRIMLGEEAEQHLRGRICRYNDWHYPAAVLRPGHETWIKDMVSFDPLYILDIDLEMLYPALSHFPVEYQDRLRRWVIRESSNDPMLNCLPRNQLGYMLVYNYFNFRPLEIIRGMLAEVYQILRPGGVMAMTFNDCDKYGAVELVERNYSCYTPGRLVTSAAEMIGYDIAHKYDVNSAVTWLELKKPGDLASLRGGQALARIVAKQGKT